MIHLKFLNILHQILDLQILLTEEKERSIKDKEVELENQTKDFKETMVMYFQMNIENYEEMHR